MNKDIETGKSAVNRTRRQLLIGAGLTPLVVTLRASRVSAQELIESVSGAAPFSGAIQGSVGPDGTPGSENTEMALYRLLTEKQDLQRYYGNMGSGSSSTTTLGTGTSYDWTYGSATSGNGNPGSWTPSFEARFWEPVKDYQVAVAEIEERTTAIRTAVVEHTQATALENNPMTDSIVKALEDLENHLPADAVGVFEIVNDAVANLPARYDSAKEKYRIAVNDFNNMVDNSSTDEGSYRLERIRSIF